MPQRQGKGRPSSVSGRGGKFAGLVRQRLNSDPHWSYRTVDGRWICPYCLSSVRPADAGSRNGLHNAVVKHLTNRCARFQEGRGGYQSPEAQAAKLQQENLAHTAMTDPAWQVFDHEGFWYSPSSLRKVPEVRIQNRRFDSLTVAQIVRHILHCPHFQQGTVHPAQRVQQARDTGMRIDKLGKDIGRLLGHPIWRYRDAAGNWVCPYCLAHDTGIIVRDERHWADLAPRMARHLLEDCAEFGPDKQQLQDEQTVRQAAQEAPPPTLRRRPTTNFYRRSSGEVTPMATPIGTAMGLDPADDHSPASVAPGQRPGTTGRTRRTSTLVRPPTDQQAPPVAKPLDSMEPSRATTNLIRPEMIDSDRLERKRRSDAGSSASRRPPPPVAPPLASTDAPAEPAEPAESGGARESAGDVLAGSFLDEDIAADTPLVASEPAASEPATSGLFGAGAEDALAGSFLDHGSSAEIPAATPVAEDGRAVLGDDALSWMQDSDAGAEIGTARETAHQDEVDRARDVQIGLLRAAPSLPGFRFASRFESCSGISGDFYDYIELPDGRIGFAQGDVSGHGMQAGLIMSMAKKVLSIYAKQLDSPREVLAALNDALVEDLGGKMFVSITYAVLDPPARTITWARAGHNPAIRYNLYEQTLSEINPPGMVVGMKAGKLFAQVAKEEVLQVQSGDLFLLYTDGITETMNRQGEEYGVELLQELIQRHATDDLEMLLDRILDSVRGFRGGTETQDDITLLGLIVD